MLERAAGAANLDVVAEAADGREVLGAVDLHRPDVVLMDIRMPQLDGIAATRLLAAQPPGTGTGLIGLAERVSLAGGTLEHGVDPDGAFVLRASLPR